MLSLEIRLAVHGKEVSVDSFVDAIVQKVRNSVREEIGTRFPKNEQEGVASQKVYSETPRQAVSIREAARLLSISPRTVDKYVALKVFHAVRVGRRVLVPMKSINEIASKGVPWRRNRTSTDGQRG